MRSAQVAYLRLREDILSGTIEPGAPLSESRVAALLGISRTPVREATSRLAQENLVTVVPGKGAFVAYISLGDVRELFQIRQVLEPFAARLAAAKPDQAAIAGLLTKFETAGELIRSGQTVPYQVLCGEMDTAISTMTDNRRLQNMLRSVWQEARRIRSLTKTNPARLLASVDEHREILSCIGAGDPGAAGAAAERHLIRCYDNIILAMTTGGPMLPVSEPLVSDPLVSERRVSEQPLRDGREDRMVPMQLPESAR